MMLGTTILEERESKYNGHIRVLRTWGMGTYIQSDGLTQSGGIVESIWRQTLENINFKKLNAKSILILGLGGGTVAKLLRKKYPKANIIGVEIDPIMIELGRKYLDLDKYDLDIKICDAVKFLKNNRKKYDLLIVDTYLGDKFVEITGLHPVIAEITVFNRLYFKNKKQEAIDFGKKLETMYRNVTWFYPTTNLMFICES